jgi:transposase-like protein
VNTVFRPLDRVDPVIVIDALVVKIRDGQVANRPCYVEMGINLGERDVLDSASASFLGSLGWPSPRTAGGAWSSGIRGGVE